MKKLLRTLTILALAGILMLMSAAAPVLAAEAGEPPQAQETLAVPASASGDGVIGNESGVRAANRTPWALYLYLCGSDAESGSGAATLQLLDIIKATETAGSDQIQVLVYTGGSKAWDVRGTGAAYNESKPDSYIQPDSVNNQLFRIEGGKMQKIRDYNDKSMGAPATAAEFLTDAFAEAPADHVILSFWDHGGAWKGAIYDEKHDDDHLDLDELRQVMAAAKALNNGKIDIVDFDCCMLSFFEVAYYLKDYASYMLASEESEPSPGQSYSWIKKFAAAGETRTAEDVGKWVIDAYSENLQTLGTGLWSKNTSGTLALTDLGQVDALAIAFNELADVLLGRVVLELADGTTDTYVKLSLLAESCQTIDPGYGSVDMYDFLSRIRDGFDDEEIKASAEAVIQILGTPPGTDPEHYVGAVDGAVVYRGTGSAHDNCIGLSLIYPLSSLSASLLVDALELYDYENMEQLRDADGNPLKDDEGRDLYLRDTYGNLIEIMGHPELQEAIPVFSGKIATRVADDGRFIGTVASGERLSIKKAEYITTFTDVSDTGEQSYMLGSALIPDASSGTFSVKPPEAWYTLGGHYITVDMDSYEPMAGGLITKVTYSLPVVLEYNAGTEAQPVWSDQKAGILTAITLGDGPDEQSMTDGNEMVMYITKAIFVETISDGGNVTYLSRSVDPADIRILPSIRGFDRETYALGSFTKYGDPEDDSAWIKPEGTDQGLLGYTLTLKSLEDNNRDEQRTVMSYFKLTDIHNQPHLSAPFIYSPENNTGNNTNNSTGSSAGGSSGSSAAVGNPVTNAGAGTTTVKVTTSAAASGATAKASVGSVYMNRAVRSAVTDAAKQETAPVVEVAVKASASTDSLELTLPASSLKTLAEAEGSTLVITSDIAEVSLDNTALSAVTSQASGSTIVLEVTPVEAGELSAAQQETIGQANVTVLDVSLLSNGAVIEDYKDGKLTVSLPYKLTDGHSADDVTVYYLADDGSMDPCDTSYKDGKVTFITRN